MKSDPIQVLLIDADPQRVAALRSALLSSSQESFELQVADDLCAGEERIAAARFDVVVADLCLPDGFGLEVVHRVLSFADDAPPLVVTAAIDDETLAVRAVQAGAQDYLVRGTADPVGLRRVLQGAIERHRMSGELDDAREREQHLVTHHPVTNLPNRALLRDRLSQAVAAAREDGRWLAVLYVDLDRFRSVNESLGDSAGDAILRAVSQRLRAAVRASDTVAHLAVDEFALVLNGVARPTDAAMVARNLLASLESPVRLGERDVSITASIGIAIYPADGADAESLVRGAAAAMQRAKDEGGDTHGFYAREMSRGTEQRFDLELELRQALTREQFELHFQPWVAGDTGVILGAEALVRWRHPERGLVPPGDFIPLAEETGMVREIGAWVLEHACRAGARWDRAGLGPIELAVNTSARQLWQRDFADRVRQVLDETGFPASRLVLEITESCVMRDVEHTVRVLNGVCEQGVRLAMDDFGTGYSSLAALKRLPLHTLKIDRSFVSDCTQGDSDATIVEATIALAGSLSLEIVGEGVETEEQRDYLLENGCLRMQGFLFSRPLPEAEFVRLLARGRIEVEKPPS